MGAAWSSQFPAPCSKLPAPWYSSSSYCFFDSSLLRLAAPRGYVRRMHRWTRCCWVLRPCHPRSPRPLCAFLLDIFPYSYSPRHRKFNYRMRILLLFFVLFVSASSVFLFQPKASQDELSAYQHLFAVDLCNPTRHVPPPLLGCQTIVIDIDIQHPLPSSSSSLASPRGGGRARARTSARALLNICQVCWLNFFQLTKWYQGYLPGKRDCRCSFSRL